MDNLLSKEKVVLAYFILALFVWIVCMFSGIGNHILGLYNFRQSQTAITAYWLVEEGFRLDYITPVLGPTWSIPMEFPTYQGIVAFFSSAFGFSLDITGRVISFTFFFLSLFPLYKLLLARGIDKSAALIPISFLLVSPFYLYWSRTFMIESTTFFFGCMALYLYDTYFRSQNWKWLILACLCGVMSALTKITTYTVFLTFLCMLTLEAMWQCKAHLNEVLKKAAAGLAIFIVPVATAVIWNIFADHQKELNPLADFIVSSNLTEFNFGTLSQRLSPETWIKYGEYIKDIIGNWGFSLIGVFSLASRKLRYLSISSLLAFMTGPLVFANLYFQHEYYFYGTGFFLILFLSLGIVALVEEGKKLTPALLVAVITISFLPTYLTKYPSIIQYESENPAYTVARLVNENTDPEDVVLIYGQDWNSSIPYYSERKSIMDRQNRPIENPEIQQSIAGLTIGAIVFCQENPRSEQFILPRLEYFGLDETSKSTAWICDIYFKN